MNPVLWRAFAAYVRQVEAGVRATLALGGRVDYWFTPHVGVFFRVRGDDAEVLGVLPAEMAAEVLTARGDDRMGRAGRTFGPARARCAPRRSGLFMPDLSENAESGRLSRYIGKETDVAPDEAVARALAVSSAATRFSGLPRALQRMEELTTSN